MANGTRFELLIPDDLRRAAEALAEKQDRSLASLIRVLLADAVKKDSAITTPPQEGPGSCQCPCLPK